jgi:dienelactone hydrolase
VLASVAVAVAAMLGSRASAAVEPTPLPGTEQLTLQGDIPAQMRAGINKFADREIAKSVTERAKLWHRDFSSAEAYDKSIEPNREHLRKMIGAVDPRQPVTQMEFVGGTSTPAKIGEPDRFEAFAVRWPVLEGVHGEGLLLRPKGEVKARVVAIPDADQTPEMIVEGSKQSQSQFARRLAESGCEVVVPMLIDREAKWSGTPGISFINAPHREWVYRAGFEVGRHPIGYEVQKVLAAVDWFENESKQKPAPIGVAGYGEGGLIALYSSALDNRIKSTLVSGYFGPREGIADEPLYRNIFGLLSEFGDAELASMIAPRSLVIEYSACPKVDGPPPPTKDQMPYGAPGAIHTPALSAVRAEVDRAKGQIPSDSNVKAPIELVTGDGDKPAEVGSDDALSAFVKPLATNLSLDKTNVVFESRPETYAPARQHRQLEELVDHTQLILQRSYKAREHFWKDADPSSPEKWAASVEKYRDYFWDEIIGRFPKATEPTNPRSRKIIEEPKFTGYEVTLGCYPDVFCYGILLVPKDIKPGERRPVVVCQHGLEGKPMDVVTRDQKDPAFPIYHGFASDLADQGFVTYAPHNFYRVQKEFRHIQRKLNPLKRSMFSIILAQHERHLEWLDSLPFVDAKRIGFYGLSYGGFSAIRLPPMLKGYALSIDSGEFSDMAQKCASVHSSYSYPFYNCSEVWEWNMSNTFGYSDLAGLMVPRPFMVERGHDDTVSPDEWVAAEYSKVRRRYDKLGLGDRTTIEFFNGVHEIHSTGTFAFLHKHLNWPESK